MASKEHVEISADAVMRLARARVDEMFKRVGPRIPAETLTFLTDEIASVLRMFEDNMPANRGIANDEIVSTSEAASLLFVSRPHVVKLIEEGKLPLHHVTGQNRFLRKADVLEYKAKKQTEARAFFERQKEGMDPRGL